MPRRRPKPIASIARRLGRSFVLTGVCVAGVGTGGCVERTISITTDPPGALIWLNDREIGRTPIDVSFVYYGTYDVRVVHENFEPLSTEGKASSPWWETVPLDLVSELLPIPLKSRVTWHYVLQPRSDSTTGLSERADELRGRLYGTQPNGN